MSKEFGNKLKSIRKEQGVTLLEIAEALGTTETTVCRWENGKAEPNITKLKKLASFLETTVDNLTDYDRYDYSFEYQNKNLK